MSPRRTILVVEDDADLRAVFRNALVFGGFDVTEASDGFTALWQIEQHRPDAIVLDLGLPTVSGYTVLQEVSARTHTRDIPVVIVTAHDPELFQGVGDAAACVLRKPVRPERLVSTVRACLTSGAPPALAD